MEALGLVDRWPVEHAAAVAVTPAGAAMLQRPGSDRFQLASVTKLLTTWAVLVAVEERTVSLDTPLDPTVDRVPEGVTLRHLLAHAAGFGFDGDAPVAPPGRRRIYSNTGIERAADVLARAAAMPFAEYLHEAVFAPLGMHRTRLDGSPAHGAVSDIGDMNLFLLEVMQPTLITASTRDDAVRPQYADLGGIVPGVGRFQPCPWGLGFELHGDKHPHWMARTNSPATYGHFGGAGTMMWVDPVAGTGTVVLTDRRFDDWAADALRLWPEYSEALLAEAGHG
ncbi:MAG TPA: serine hydrolase domain-containing protein [Ilumatobacter sp.]|nr:serine hydrolase domain-containing protein [Ilumatobacter sp.]